MYYFQQNNSLSYINYIKLLFNKMSVYNLGFTYSFLNIFTNFSQSPLVIWFSSHMHIDNVQTIDLCINSSFCIFKHINFTMWPFCRFCTKLGPWLPKCLFVALWTEPLLNIIILFGSYIQNTAFEENTILTRVSNTYCYKIMLCF